MLMKGSDHDIGDEHPLTSADDRKNWQAEIFNRIKNIVQDNLQKAHEDGRKRYDLLHRAYAKALDVGQLVYRRNMKPSSAIENYNAKYGPQYLSARVIRKDGSSSYEIADLDGKSLGIWPAVHLKLG